MEGKHYIIDSFSVENFLSIKDKQTIFFDSEVKAFYGANASGKTNLYKAMLLVRRFIRNSANPGSHGTPFIPFLLAESTKNAPSSFSITFHSAQDQNSYRYAFSATPETIIEEEMYDLSSSRPRLIFKRSDGPTDGATRNGFNKKMFEGNESVRDDSLLITFARVAKNPYASAVYEAIRSISFIDLSEIDLFRGHAVNLLQKHPEYHDELTRLFKEADLPINGFSYSITRITPASLVDSPFNEKTRQFLMSMGQNITVNTVHTVRNEAGDRADSVIFDMDTQESLGTNFFFNLAIAVIDVIHGGKVLYVDEFGTSIHTKLCEFIIKYFMRDSRKTGARLLINTHDIGLIKNGSLGVLAPENIMLTEKSSFDSTVVVPLKDRMWRPDENISKKYTLGLYGGVPILGEAAE